jgi:hypothetical protein
MTQRPIMTGQAPRQRQEQERAAPLRAPVIKAVTTVTNSNVTLWTVSADKFFYLKHASVCNIAGAAITFTLHVVPEGGSAGNGNKVYDVAALANPDTKKLDEIIGMTIDPGDFIVAVTSSATGANFRLDGVEFTGGLPDV